MQIRYTFLQNLLKSICNTELTVHDHRMSVPYSHTDRLYHSPMPARSYGTEIMLIIEYSGRFYTSIPEIGNRRSDVKETALPF